VRSCRAGSSMPGPGSGLCCGRWSETTSMYCVGRLCSGQLAGSAGLVAMEQVVAGSFRRRSRLGPVAARSVPVRRHDLRRPAGRCAGGLAASRPASARHRCRRPGRPPSPRSERAGTGRSESPRGSLLGVGLAIFGLLGASSGQLAPVGGQGLAGGHVLGHIGQPPGRGPGRPPQPLEGGLRVQMLAADDYAFGLLDQPPVLQGGLELVGQPALGLGGRTRRLQTDLACSRRCLVGPDGSRRTQSDRLDDQRDDQGPSDTRSDGKASCFLDGSKSRLGGLPHGGSRVRPSVPTDGSGCRRANVTGWPG
jgi:hypothetical protein